MSQKRRRRERYIHPGDLAYIVNDGSLFGLVAGQVAMYEGRFKNGKRVTNSRADGCTPRFRLKDGSIWHGYECWWVPFRKAVDAAKAMGPDGEAGLRRLYAARNAFRGY